MQKIEINNFGPIKEASIEIKPLLVFIGEQASGKSTIAKLVYFFKSLSADFFTRYYQSRQAAISMKDDLVMPIRKKFYDFFGSTFHLPDFNIVYYYTEERSLTLSLTPEKKLLVHFSDDFFSQDDRTEMRGYKTLLMQLNEEIALCDSVAQRVVLDQNHLEQLHKLADKINAMFQTDHNDSLFILAGRNATVGYSDFFENLLYQNLQKNIEEQGNRAFESKEQTIDETLMLSFMQRVAKLRQSFVKFGNFEGMIAQSNGTKKKHLTMAKKLINEVLHGQYANSDFGERIVHKGGGFVYLKNASSGQQESIRILQDAFLSMYQGNNLLRIVEEPETHLFPVAQKAAIELLILTLNSNQKNQLVLTTHSPYTLTVINNLIYASQVGKSFPDEVRKIIPTELWMAEERVAAYMLQAGVARNIIDPELKQIKAELIDKVSAKINSQYTQILDLDSQNEEGE